MLVKTPDRRKYRRSIIDLLTTLRLSPAAMRPAMTVSIAVLAALAISPRLAQVQTREEKSPSQKITVHAASKSTSLVHLKDGYELSARISKDASVAAAQQGLGNPLSIASADFDEDGVPDLITGYAGGKLALYRGNIDAIFPNSRDAQQRKAKGQFTDEAFLPKAQVIDVPEPPGMIAAGDFNADGHKDVLVGSSGSDQLTLLAGDGHGNFSQPNSISLGGTIQKESGNQSGNNVAFQITALATGEIGKPDGQTDVAVAVNGPGGPRLLVYEHPEGAFKHPPEVFPLTAPATNIVLGDLDGDNYSDIAIASGTVLTIIHERGQAYPWDMLKQVDLQRPPAIVEARSMPFAIEALAIGEFSNQRGNSLALLSDGSISLLQPTKPTAARESAAANPQTASPRFLPKDETARGLAVMPKMSDAEIAKATGAPTVDSSLSHDEIKKLSEKTAKDEAAKVSKLSKEERVLFQTEAATKTANRRERTKAAFLHSVSAQPSPLAQWDLQTLAANSGLRASGPSAAKKLIATRISVSGRDDLVVIDSAANQLNIVAQSVQPASVGGQAAQLQNQQPKAEIISLDVESMPVAALPMHLNPSALSDLVILRNGSTQPSIVTPASTTYTVNDASDNTSFCTGGNDLCTLRGAINAANQNPGSTIAFNIPSAGVPTIAPFSELPIVRANGTIINGTTQPGASGGPRIEIKGNNFQQGQAIDGLKIRASNCFVIGLAINEFPSFQDPDTGSLIGGNGLTLESTTLSPNNGNNYVLANYLGTDPGGTLDKGNQATGLNIFVSDNNTVGGTAAAFRNVISGNGTQDEPGAGIALTAANNNVIQGNYIGVDSNGTQPLGNSQGMFLTGSSNQIGGDDVGAGNVISGNGEGSRVIAPDNHCQGYGLYETLIFGDDGFTNLTLNNIVKGNKIGTNAAGTAEVGNCWQGIITNTLTQMVVGSITANGRNVISGNRFGAIIISGVGNAFAANGYGGLYLGGYTIISGNNIGTDITGTVSVANNAYNGCFGPCFEYGDVTVFPGDLAVVNIGSPGGTSPGGACTGLCNLVSGDRDLQQPGNGGLEGAITRDFEGGTVGIFNNYIGTDRTGTQALPNSFGVWHLLGSVGPTFIGGAAPANPGGPVDTSLGNLISGNYYEGITFAHWTDVSFCQSNLIGTDAIGNNPIPNGPNQLDVETAVYLFSVGFSPFYLGGTNALERNVISGNGARGINITGNVVVKNNYIGTNKAGAAPLPNVGAGVYSDQSVQAPVVTTIGGTESGAANLIENNGEDGITITGGGSPLTFDQVVGNTITNNGGAGIHIGLPCSSPFGPCSLASYNNQIGGTSAGEGNIIANNSGPGIFIRDGVGNNILANSIHDNVGLGIDLSPTDPADGVTVNDCGDTDAGPNDLQNYPVLAAPIFNGDGTVSVTGTLRSEPFQTYRVDFYSSSTADPSGYGEGEIYIGSTNVTADGNGFVNIAATSSGPVPSSSFITSTATNENGSTSEFSCIAGQCAGSSLASSDLNNPQSGGTCPPPMVVNVTTDADDSDLTDGVCDTDLNTPGFQCSLRAAIEQANDSRALSRSISFNIPGSGVQTITPASALPTITQKVQVYGFTQGGTPNTHLIEINGLNAGNSNGITLGNGSDGSVIAELTINRFQGAGIAVLSSNNKVTGCYLGLDSNGFTFDPNRLQGSGILVNTTGNRVGGPTFEANVISGNQLGITLNNGGNNTVVNNKIGTNKDGNAIQVNSNQVYGNTTGVFISSSNNNVIGGKVGETGNLISGNAADGVLIATSQGNHIEGNYIGTDATGLQQVENGMNGVNLSAAAQNNIVGGAQPDQRNVISGNRVSALAAGVLINSNANTGNQVLGNYIGVKANGQVGLSNNIGVAVLTGGNIIGSIQAPNVIASNLKEGIAVQGLSTITNTAIVGNYIGVNQNGDRLGNLVGIALTGDVQTTSIKNNTISGNDTIGVAIALGTGSTGPTNNTVSQNKIGTNPSGSTAVFNSIGIAISQASMNNITGNLISGNSTFGISLGDNIGDGSVLTSANKIQGNLIGTNADGAFSIPNALGGVALIDDAQGNFIGGSVSANQGNVISGNFDLLSKTDYGVFIGSKVASPPTTALPSGNLVQGNRIGLQKGADVGLPNNFGVYVSHAQNNIIGGDTADLANLIGFNTQDGVLVTGADTVGNVIKNNTIGGNGGFGISVKNVIPGASQKASGSTPRERINAPVGSLDIAGNFVGLEPPVSNNAPATTPNALGGIHLDDASGVNIGSATLKNIISGNNGPGIIVEGNSSQNIINNDIIGTDENATDGLGNQGDGVEVLNGASLNTIERCLIARNARNGILLQNADANRILGDTVGWAKRNGVPITLANLDAGLRIIDSANEEVNKTADNLGAIFENAFSGNDGPGIVIEGTSSSNNLVKNTTVGSDENGDDLGNGGGGILIKNAPNNTIGGAGEGDVVSGNQGVGILLQGASAKGTKVIGNFIGTDPNADPGLGNSADGILIEDGANNNAIGGPNAGDGNKIAFNQGSGVDLEPSAGTGNIIDPNVITGNAKLGIDLGGGGTVLPNDPGDGDSGPNNLQNYPEFSSALIAQGNLVIQYKVNSAPGNSNYGTGGLYVELFKADASLQGQTFIASTNYTVANYNAGTPGLATLIVPNAAGLSIQVGDKIVATATDADGNTSEFTSTNAGIVGSPTAANGTVGGTIADGSGASIAGTTINLSGTESRETITDSNGKYRFDDVETNGFYTVTPARANYTFSPPNRSFSLLGVQTDASFTASANGDNANAIDTTEFFVRQQYLDFLGREPDPPGFNGWVNTIKNCAPNDPSCDRVHVSEMFFRSQEFQERGYFVFRFYSSAFGQKPDYAEFTSDLARVSGFLTNSQLEAAKTAFVTDFMARLAFAAQYNSLSNAAYVDALVNTAAVGLSNRQALIDGLNAGTLTRAQVLRQVAESGEVYQKYYNQAFVVMEYFGYLRRDPDALYTTWIQVLDKNRADSRRMVEGFVNSTEYRNRFGP